MWQTTRLLMAVFQVGTHTSLEVVAGFVVLCMVLHGDFDRKDRLETGELGVLGPLFSMNQVVLQFSGFSTNDSN